MRGDGTVPDSEKLKKIMQARGITGYALAKRMNMPRGNCYNLINKQTNARESTIRKLCEILECTPNDIM